MQLEQLIQFSKLKSYTSLNKASDSLYTSHQSLSKMISALENEFQVELIVRTPSGISFTAEGKYLLERTDEIVNLLEQTKQQLVELHSPKVTCNTINIFTDVYSNESILSELLPYLEKHFPALTFSITMIDSQSASLLGKNYSHITGLENTIIFLTQYGNYIPHIKENSSISHYLLTTRELFLTSHKLIDLSDLATVSIILNTSLFGEDIYDYLPSSSIFPVKSYYQCQMSLQTNNSLCVFPENLIDKQKYCINSFQPPLYSYSYLFFPKANMETNFLETILNYFHLQKTAEIY